MAITRKAFLQLAVRPAAVRQPGIIGPHVPPHLHGEIVHARRRENLLGERREFSFEGGQIAITRA